MPSVASPRTSSNEDLTMKTTKDDEKKASNKKKRMHLKVKTEQLFGDFGFKKLKSCFVGMKRFGLGHEVNSV
jgi:hypothetical protein